MTVNTSDAPDLPPMPIVLDLLIMRSRKMGIAGQAIRDLWCEDVPGVLVSALVMKHGTALARVTLEAALRHFNDTYK